MCKENVVFLSEGLMGLFCLETMDLLKKLNEKA